LIPENGPALILGLATVLLDEQFFQERFCLDPRFRENCDMAVAHLPSIGAIALLLTLSVLSARATTLDEYIELTGELTVVVWGGCQLETDPEAYREFSASFAQLGAEKREEVEKRIEDAILSADDRRKRMGDPAFCAEIIAKYGPKGTKQRGLLKSGGRGHLRGRWIAGVMGRFGIKPRCGSAIAAGRGTAALANATGVSAQTDGSGLHIHALRPSMWS
jgi:hypothetical protein